MKRLRDWLLRQFLPRYAHELLWDELALEQKKRAEAQRTIAEQRCYIAGLEYALRQLRGCRFEEPNGHKHENCME